MTRSDVPTVLLSFANPTATFHLRQNEEARAVERALDPARAAGHVRIEYQSAARAEELLQYLNRAQPRILHASAHGREDGALLYESEGGGLAPLAPEGLVRVLAAAERPPLIVLSACHSDRTAQRCADVVGHAIGMTGRIPDGCARAFAASFYASYVTHRHCLHRAFEQGLAGIATAPGGAEHVDQPRLLGSSTQTTYFHEAPRVAQGIEVLFALDANPGNEEALLSYLRTLPIGPGIELQHIPRNLILSAATVLDTASVRSWVSHGVRLTLSALHVSDRVPQEANRFAVTVPYVVGRESVVDMVETALLLAGLKSRANLAALLLTLPRSATSGAREADLRSVLSRCEARE